MTEGSKWLTHRPPTIQYPADRKIEKKHIDSEAFYRKTGVEMYHYSYVFPKQVKNKIEYYKAKVSMSKCIDQYYENIYLPWITSSELDRYDIEKKYSGVHEWKPVYRGPSFTAEFDGAHPKAIANNMADLQDRISKELEES